MINDKFLKPYNPGETEEKNLRTLGKVWFF
jgi:hypothetical protein